MTPEVAQFSNRGMNQDISVSKATNEFAFENYNIRITAVNDNTLLSVTNEKLPSTLTVSIKDKKRPNKITLGKEIIENLGTFYKFVSEYPVESDVAINYTVDKVLNIATIKTDNQESSTFSITGDLKTYFVQSPISDDKYYYYTEYEKSKDTTTVFLDTIEGTYLGHSILNDTLVLFTKKVDGEYKDFIYALKLDGNTLVGEIKYKGNLNFSLDHPIETLPYYESELVQKVYWVDGLNQPRVINIAAEDIIERPDTQFDFNPTITKFPEVTITKEYSGVGLFPAGVIQYFVSYYNKYGAETGIVWASDLQYVTEYNRAAGPDETVVCNFKIDISNVDTTYDYARVYSMQRTSLNTTPICRIVGDININNSNSITIIDTNTNTETIDPTQLLFLGGDNFIASTLTQKDNVLFLGDLEIKNAVTEPEVIKLFDGVYDDSFKSSIINFEYKEIQNSEFQLKKSEESIKTFKYGELYRFGIQFQSKDSKWTIPIWIGDRSVNIRPIVEEGIIKVPTAVLSLSNTAKETISKYYINYRLLIAEATNADRRILAQGIVNPTVFNYEQRVKNTGPYAQASWLFRPRNGKAAFEHLDGLGNKVTKTEDGTLEFTNLPTCEIQNSLNKLPGVLSGGDESGVIINIYTKNTFYQYDILKVTGDSLDNFGSVEEKLYSDYISTSSVEEASEWLVDSISDKLSISTSELGISKETLYTSLNTIQHNTSNATGNINNTTWEFGWFAEKPGGEYIRMDAGVSNTIHYGGCVTFRKVDDAIIDRTEEYKNNYYVDSSILTFHSPEVEDNLELFDGANLSVNIIGVVPVDETTSELNVETETAGYSGTIGANTNYNKEENKALVNEAVFKDNGWTEKGVLNTNSLVSYYMYTWNKQGSIIGQTADSMKDGPKTGTDDLEELTTTYAKLKIKTFANKYYSKGNHYFTGPSFDIKPTVFSSKELDSKLLYNFNKEVIYQGNCDTVVPTTTYKTLSKDLNYYKVFWKDYTNIDGYSEDLKQYDPVSIKYKTMPHLAFNIGDTALPALYTKETLYWQKLNTEYGSIDTISYPWVKNSNIDLYSQLNLEEAYSHEINIDTPYFYLVEVARTFIDSSKIYGGTSENAIENIKWIPASNATPVNQNITTSYGDTYFQRWNCLHSYQYAPEDNNSVIEVASFMVETHKNIESIYDKNKIIQRLLTINSETFNKDNPVYSQTNNYFTYNILDEKFNQNKYFNQVAFSLQKTPTSEIDTWCNISLASAFNLDGKYGKLNKLITVNDAILAFQDKALSVINFNNRTAISTENGVPIEIANSGKVNGYSVISSNIGCQNKLSICEASSGVYFIDDLNKTMYGFNKEGLSNISSKGMSMWFKKNLTGEEKCFYDKLTNDVYVTNNTDCLVYNEALDAFTSFMDYSNINSLFNFEGKSFIFKGDSKVKVRRMFEGDYTNSYYIQYKINPEPLTDKTFTNIEFIADKLNNDDIDSFASKKNLFYPFTEFEVWNEYQYGITNLTKGRTYPNFERKFRVWRADIPRDESNGRDRIRNPWIYLKLNNKDNNNAKMVFHSFLVKYYK